MSEATPIKSHMTVIMGDHAPIKSWADNPDEMAIAQAKAVASLPFVISHVALMPDAHGGYGMPIGGVLFAERAVVPYAVGVDIGCGVALIETNITVDSLEDGVLQKIINQIARDVPYGRAGHVRPLLSEDEAFTTLGAHELAGLSGPKADSWNIMHIIYRDSIHQLGSLGGGNHFIEVERDAEGHVYIMLHSGSRSYGKKTCDYYHDMARTLNKRWHSKLPVARGNEDNTYLSYLSMDDVSGKDYMTAMDFGLRWAELNRKLMAGLIIKAFEKYVAGFDGHLTIDVHHNYAAWENHNKKNGIVHRKGAVRANSGETVLIPGSMGVGSYIALGRGNPRSFSSCQHGAGRAMSRHEATQRWNKTGLAQIMKNVGVLMAGDAAIAVDEAPEAYKDLESVMEQASDLIIPIRKLTPLGVIKGD